MKTTYKAMLVGLLTGMLAGPQWGYAAASGNYTDLLPVGAAGNTTVISNGSGWSLTTLPPTQTFGDALSRVVTSPYQLYISTTINTTTAESTMTVTAGSVGSTTFPAAWVASGRSIRITARGIYSTANAVVTWRWRVKLGTTTVLDTIAVNATANQTAQPFSASAILTISTTGASGTVNGEYDINTSSGNIPSTDILYSTATTSAVPVDLTSQLTVNPTITWGTSSASDSITINTESVEFLN